MDPPQSFEPSLDTIQNDKVPLIKVTEIDESSSKNIIINGDKNKEERK